MRRRSRAGGKPVKTRRRKTATLKRRDASKAVAHRSSSAAILRKQLDDRTRELKEALEQQAATADVLKVISRSTFDLQTVLNTLVESAARLCEAEMANIWRPKDGVYRLAASYGVTERYREYVRNKELLETVAIEPGRGTVVGRTLLEGKTVHINDLQADPDFNLSRVTELGAYRSTLGIPLLRQGVPIGVIVLTRTEVRPFTDKQIELVSTFAAQAVIAIENTRLLNELRQSLDQQTATADVLRVISSSPGDLQPVFDAMLANATRLCDASYGTLWLHEGDGRMHAAALYGNLPEAFLKTWGVGTIFRPRPSVPSARAMSSRKPVQLVDLKEDQSYLDDDPLAVAAVDVAGIRSIISVPMGTLFRPVAVPVSCSFISAGCSLPAERSALAGCTPGAASTLHWQLDPDIAVCRELNSVRRAGHQQFGRFEKVRSVVWDRRDGGGGKVFAGTQGDSGLVRQHKDDVFGILHGVVVIVLFFRDYDGARQVHIREKINRFCGRSPGGVRREARMRVPVL